MSGPDALRDNAPRVISTTLSRNLAALSEAGHPIPAGVLHAADDVDVLQDGDRPVGVALRTPSGPVPMQSGRDPVGEARRWITSEALAASAMVVVGGGAGHVLEALQDRGYTGRVLVFEPSRGACLAALARADWTTAIAARRLRWLVGPEYEGWTGAWSWLAAGEAPSVLIHPVLGRERPQDVREALGVVRQVVSSATANARARNAFAWPYLRNTIQNLPALLASADVAALFGRFTGMPAVLVAAGPSLDDNLPALRAMAGRALVLSTDTALRPLLAAHVTPQFVVGVDPSALNARHLDDLPALPATCLVGEPSLHPRALRTFSDRLFTFRVDDHHPWPWLASHDVARATLRAWGSVLTTTFDLACQMGCDPIVFVGADLAYTRGLMYCRNTTFEPEWRHLATDAARAAEFEPYLRQRGAISVPDMHGQQTLVAPHFVQFRDWLLARAVAVEGQRIVNATGAGLLAGRAIQQATLQDVLGREPALTVDLAGLLAATTPGSASRALRSAVGADLVAAPDATVAEWLRFAGGEAHRDELLGSLRNAARRLTHPEGETAQMSGEPGDIRHITTFDDIPPHARVLVAGLNSESLTLHRRLLSRRPDVRSLGFVDVTTSGSRDGVPVSDAARLAEADYDVVLLCDDPGQAFPDALLRHVQPATSLRCGKALWEPGAASSYRWLDEALPTLDLSRPILVIGKGPGATRVPAGVNQTHSVIGLEQTHTTSAWCDLTIVLTARGLVECLFSPGAARHAGRVLVPDGLAPSSPAPADAAGIASQLQALAGLAPQFRPAWGWDRMLPFEEVDQALDLQWAGDRLIRFALENIYWDWKAYPEWPNIDTDLHAFRPERLSNTRLLRSGSSVAHLALCLLHHAGIRDVLLAGVESDQERRWSATTRILDHLGITWRRVEDLAPTELDALFTA